MRTYRQERRLACDYTAVCLHLLCIANQSNLTLALCGSSSLKVRLGADKGYSGTGTYYPHDITGGTYYPYYNEP